MPTKVQPTQPDTDIKEGMWEPGYPGEHKLDVRLGHMTMYTNVVAYHAHSQIDWDKNSSLGTEVLQEESKKWPYTYDTQLTSTKMRAYN